MMNRRHALTLTGAALAAPLVAKPLPAYQVDEVYRPTAVRVKRDFKVGRIYIVPQTNFLYHVTEPRKAIRYGVASGRASVAFRDTASVQKKVEWPSWRPTDEMIERDPGTYAKYKDGVPGGPDNPLGARAMYLFQGDVDTYIRIHGTNEPESIGRNVSNGCFRMVNEHVIALYNQVPMGTVVTVF